MVREFYINERENGFLINVIKGVDLGFVLFGGVEGDGKNNKNFGMRLFVWLLCFGGKWYVLVLEFL